MKAYYLLSLYLCSFYLSQFILNSFFREGEGAVEVEPNGLQLQQVKLPLSINIRELIPSQTRKEREALTV